MGCWPFIKHTFKCMFTLCVLNYATRLCNYAKKKTYSVLDSCFFPLSVMTDGKNGGGGGCGQHWRCVWFSLLLNHEPLIKRSERKYFCTTHQHANKLSLSLPRFPFLIGIMCRGIIVHSFFFFHSLHIQRKNTERQKKRKDENRTTHAHLYLWI